MQIVSNLRFGTLVWIFSGWRNFLLKRPRKWVKVILGFRRTIHFQNKYFRLPLPNSGGHSNSYHQQVKSRKDVRKQKCFYKAPHFVFLNFLGGLHQLSYIHSHSCLTPGHCSLYKQIIKSTTTTTKQKQKQNKTNTNKTKYHCFSLFYSVNLHFCLFSRGYTINSHTVIPISISKP